jgi:molybdate transport system substrate-binding protein
MRRAVLTLTVAATGLILLGCASSSRTGESSSTTSSQSGPSTTAVSGTVNVFAASSLREAFTTLGQQFEATHPGTKVVFNFGPSSGLATQIAAGAPADVFAAASTKNMDQVVAAGRATAPMMFASNVMQIAVPARNPAGLTSLSDLARPGVKVALCQAVVPCGVTAAKAFANAKLQLTPVTQELDVKAVLTKVTLGEVDAGVVYLTDVRAAGAKVRAIEIPTDLDASTEYPIATLTNVPNQATAQAFADYVLSADGARILISAGFSKP